MLPTTAKNPSEELLAESYKFFLDYYREHKLDYTYAYDGVLEALDALHKVHDQLDVPARAMAVLTNKPVRPAQAICEALGLAPYFCVSTAATVSPLRSPIPRACWH